LEFSFQAWSIVTGQTAPLFAMETQDEVQVETYGKLPDGREVRIFTLRNANGLCARVMEYGAVLVSLEVPDASGHCVDVTHGYDHLEDWLNDPFYLGASVGRFGNRIQHGKFSLDGQEYTLATNNAPGGIPSSLHGGVQGFDKVLWHGEVTAHGVEFSYTSVDGEEGFPGNLRVKITYSLNAQNQLIWQAEAVTDAPTVVNLVHHSYWNLSGDASQLITDHLLTLHADAYLPTDAGLIPTGEIAPVVGSPMDFTQPTRVGERIGADFEPLKFAGGYDHAWVLRGGAPVSLAARLVDPKSGRVMEVLTDQPAIQFYAGNFLDGKIRGKRGVVYAPRSGLCLETEGFPDAPNQPAFPSAVLRPGEVYRHTLIHQFSAE
jgi:aldose 1-epimerase